MIYVRATPRSPSIEMDLGAPTLVDVETYSLATSLEARNIGTASASFEFYAKALRTQNTFREALLFESGGATDGMAMYMNYKHEIILSLCMDLNTRSTFCQR